MTAWPSKTIVSLSLAFIGALAACTGSVEIPIETPIQPKLDVSPFQRVFIAGFIAGESEDVDGNMETVRLLRSQLRSRGVLRVIDADTLPLIDVARQSGDTTEPPANVDPGSAEPPAPGRPPEFKDEKD